MYLNASPELQIKVAPKKEALSMLRHLLTTALTSFRKVSQFVNLPDGPVDI